MLEVLNSDSFLSLLNEFSIKIEDRVSIANNQQANFNSSKNYSVIWKVETGLYDDNLNKWLVEDLVLYVAFKDDFPYSIPKIYFDKSNFKNIGHIPHVSYWDTDICVFDDFVLVDESRPLDIILEVYNKAKKVLFEGINKNNIDDFLDEFKAYWNNISSNEDKIDKKFYYSLLDDEQCDENSINILSFTKPQNKITEHIIYSRNEVKIKDYIVYLETNSIPYKVLETFYIGINDEINSPPFNLTYQQSLKYIKNRVGFEKYFNLAKDYTNYVIFSKKTGDNIQYFGWKYTQTPSDIKGFRKGSLTAYDTAFGQFLPYCKKNVIRFSSEIINETRIFNRTSSESIESKKYKFLIAGIGSVGSNLAYFLNNINFPDFTFVDSDSLGVENIGRHFLGFDDVNCIKAEMMSNFFKKKYPSQNISIFNESFYDLYNNDSTVFENQDYIFLCTGKMNLEKWMISKVENKEISKPIFIIWVEPYLLGGQCVFIHPHSNVNFNELFTDIYKYKYSVIKHEEFETKRKLFVLKESGCQSNFSPYSSTHLTLFLSSIFSDIFSIIENKDSESLAITWIGDKKIAEKLNIDLNYDSDVNYSKIINRL